MKTRETTASRPGGRSARVQAAVHRATRELLDELGRTGLTIPLIAARAGVTPSTIYRRWGELPELLGDVAVERLRPDQPPADTGSLRGDLTVWLDQFAEEMSSGPGRALIRDVLAGSGDDMKAGRCCAFTRSTLAVLVDRATERGEAPPPLETLIDGAVAPVMYRILFDTPPLPEGYAAALIDRLLPDQARS